MDTTFAFLLHLSEHFLTHCFLANNCAFSHFHDNKLSGLHTHVYKAERFGDAFVIHPKRQVFVVSKHLLSNFVLDPVETEAICESLLVEWFILVFTLED